MLANEPARLHTDKAYGHVELRKWIRGRNILVRMASGGLALTANSSLGPEIVRPYRPRKPGWKRRAVAASPVGRRLPDWPRSRLTYGGGGLVRPGTYATTRSRIGCGYVPGEPRLVKVGWRLINAAGQLWYPSDGATGT